jgi:hypothetical protein
MESFTVGYHAYECHYDLFCEENINSDGLNRLVIPGGACGS